MLQCTLQMHRTEVYSKEGSLSKCQQCRAEMLPGMNTVFLKQPDESPVGPFMI